MSIDLNSEEISDLITLIQESYRSTKTGVKRFVEPAAGTLKQATNKTHNIVFGRRGSGKSSLLRKAAADLTVDRRPIAYIDLETFKGHSYPDVLLSVLIQTFEEFEEWLRTAAINPANKTSFWQNLFGTTPKRSAFNRKAAEKLADKLMEKKDELNELLFSSDQINIEKTTRNQADVSTTANVGAKVGHLAAEVNSQVSRGENQSAYEETRETFQKNKVEFLHRHILEYQRIFKEMSELAEGGSYLFLDDLYYIKRADQAKVIDYFHRIAKGNSLWLKVGTVRHRSTWYIHGDPPYGLKLGDDTLGINLDLTLEDYTVTKEFLMKILRSFIAEAKIIDVKEILVDEAIDRLVLASGGVARDFLGIFDLSIAVSKERGANYRGPKIGQEDVNIAAGRYASTKMDEFKEDIIGNEGTISLEEAFRRIKEFCINGVETNLFLLDITDEKGLAIIQELMDLRLIHKVNSHVTVSGRQGLVFEAYMLDVSAYADMRKKKGFEEIKFWGGRNEKMRRASLILKENYLMTKEPPVLPGKDISEDKDISESDTTVSDMAVSKDKKHIRQLPLNLKI
ncbi:MAG: hypothetical protein WBR35_03140 [Anaerolineae bacterium]